MISQLLNCPVFVEASELGSSLYSQALPLELKKTTQTNTPPPDSDQISARTSLETTSMSVPY